MAVVADLVKPYIVIHDLHSTYFNVLHKTVTTPHRTAHASTKNTSAHPSPAGKEK